MALATVIDGKQAAASVIEAVKAAAAGLEVMQSDHQHHGVGRRRQEADGLVEGSCVI